jgi:thymidylate synthase ThyX
MENYENFTEEQIKSLEKYVSNITGNVFALKNLPEVIKGALFSRYSRSSLGLRSLLLKEFILNEETNFNDIVGNCSNFSQEEAIKKAQNFYDRILDGYGDDSIGELGGAHLALENISMLAAKAVEDCRVGASPLEKSTRYICFDQKENGEYRFYKEPILMTSAYRDLYTQTCNLLFETYSKLIAPLTALMEKKCPAEHQISKAAYISALRAKVLDCLRGILPASAQTNVGIFGNGRFFEHLLQKLNSSNMAELQELGKDTYAELLKIIPSFVKRTDPSSKYEKAYLQFAEQMHNDLKLLTQSHSAKIKEEKELGVSLISYDPDAVYKIAAALLFENSHCKLKDLLQYCHSLPEEELARILDAACLARETRRHKSPRALELADFTFEITADFGIYRDLQRHRMLTQQRQLLTCDLGYYLPHEIIGTDMEKEYVHAMEQAKKAYDAIAQELPEEAQYVVPMAYNMHWYMNINLRALQWMCELRSSPAGHPNYRYVAQALSSQVCEVFPLFERFFKFVDFEGYDLGRMGQEIRRVEKMKERNYS